MGDVCVMSSIEATYRQRTPGSAELAAQARQIFPSGVTHDGRFVKPHGIYVERGRGSHKWDVDGNEYVDYFGGHGALLLGHACPQVVDAVQAAIAGSSQFAAGHEDEIRWAAWIKRLMPSAQRIRFTASGTEATLMALRLCRAYTGKSKVLRFQTNFHGWNDHMTSGWSSHFDGSPVIGVISGVAEKVVLVPPGDIDQVREVLSNDTDIACTILEPTGGMFGKVPVTEQFLAQLREVTAAHGVPLIFDEVITGFRVSPGGAQAHFGITPDLTTVAKIVAGGLPGGAVIGRREFLELIDFDLMAQRGTERVAHPGTFNANPVSAAAGIAALQIIAETDACERANDLGEKLRDGLNEVLVEQQVPWAAYGTFSGFHLFTNSKDRPIDPLEFDPQNIPCLELKATRPQTVHNLRLAMLVNGVDISGWPGGLLSATHTAEDIARTTDAFREALQMLRSDGVL